MNSCFVGAKSVFLFEKDENTIVDGALMHGEVSVKIDLTMVKISGSADFTSINNNTYQDVSLKVKFHGDFLVGKILY